MADPTQVYTQVSPPPPQSYNPYAEIPPPQLSFNTPPPPMSVQQPQATYQQQPQMSYGPPQGGMPVPQQGYNEKGAPPQGYQPGPPVNPGQPMPQPGMNPNAPAGHQYDANGERDWSHDLFDCFGDCGTCCFAYFCPCMVYQQVKSRVDHLQANQRPHPERGGAGFGGDCFLYGALHVCCGLGWVLQMTTRATIRTRHKIRGSGGTDCLASCCCIPCELTQESRELDVEEAGFH